MTCGLLAERPPTLAARALARVFAGLPAFDTTALVAAPALVMATMAVPLLGSADAENRAECERFVMLSAGAGHLLLLGWGVALVLRGL